MSVCVLCREEIVTTDPSSIIWKLPEEINRSSDICAVWLHPNCLDNLASHSSFIVDPVVYRSYLIATQPEPLVIIANPEPVVLFYYIQHHTNPLQPPFVVSIDSFEYETQ